jgi:pyridoxine kinase
MPLVLILSSSVAASRVGGSVAPFALGPRAIDPVLVPTVSYGRHPGWGAPGGAPTPLRQMRSMIEAVEAQGLFPMVDVVLTGYFASPAQVRLAATTIAYLRAAARPAGAAADGEAGAARRGLASRPLVAVDPVMGDFPRGAYVAPETAAAIAEELVPSADLVTPNLWELLRLSGREPDAAARALDPAAVAALAAGRGGDWLVSSVRDGASGSRRIGAVLATPDGAWYAGAGETPPPTPQGAGDLLALVFIGARLCGAAPPRALAEAVGATRAVIAAASAWRAPELPLAACWRLLAEPPPADLEAITAR